jgi:hypothetical protein
MNARYATTLVLLLTLCTVPMASAQWTPEKPGSDNIEVLGHIPLGPRLSVADMDVEQELSRPYAYVSRMVYGDEGPKGTDIISIADPANPKVIYRWRIEDQDLHLRTGAMDVKYFKWDGRYYVVQSLQFGQGGPDNDLGAVILDVTGLPDPKKVKEVARIREPELPGGFHNIFVYKHSNGRVLLMSTVAARSRFQDRSLLSQNRPLPPVGRDLAGGPRPGPAIRRLRQARPHLRPPPTGRRLGRLATVAKARANRDRSHGRLRAGIFL